MIEKEFYKQICVMQECTKPWSGIVHLFFIHSIGYYGRAFGLVDFPLSWMFLGVYVNTILINLFSMPGFVVWNNFLAYIGYLKSIKLSMEMILKNTNKTLIFAYSF